MKFGTTKFGASTKYVAVKDINFIVYRWSNRSLSAEKHLCPDGTRLKQNAQARQETHAKMLVNWSMKIWSEKK